MKVVAICGSPRRGNTEQMLGKILAGAANAGAETELIRLSEKKIEHCNGCGYCGDARTCNIEDDYNPVAEKVVGADAVILGSPAYFNNVSGLMKDFIDRFDPYWQHPKMKGKPLVLVSVGAETYENSVKYCEFALEQFALVLQARVIGKITARASEPNSVGEEKLKECFAMGEQLAQEKAI